ncbi:hypothetical protein AYK24_08375 [Thermoplasmatales archaeon SG8-52-4]|nr:MAG: hypothetical protein AYK24_08375 [Thermoplasmatales archaeon SG8-52-4]
MAIFDPLIELAQTPMGTIVLIGLCIVGVYYVITRYFTGKEQDKFEIETFEDVVLKDLDEKMKIRGIKTNCALVQGFDFLGSVDRWMREKGKYEQLVYDEKKDKYIEPKEKVHIDYDIYIFRIWKTNFLYKFFGFGDKRYIIVNKTHLLNVDTKKVNLHQWNLKSNIQMVRWGGVFVSSAITEDYISDISIKRSHENTMTFMMNYARKIIYLEMKHSQNIDKYAMKKKIDRKSWESYKRAEDIEDDEDD